MIQEEYRKPIYQPNDFSEENLPRRRRQFSPVKKKRSLSLPFKKKGAPLAVGILLGLYLIAKLILGSLSSFMWNIPNFIGLPLHDTRYALIVFSDEESFGSTGKALWFGEMHFSNGLYAGTKALEPVQALPIETLNPIRQALFETKNYPLDLFNFDLSLESNYKELQKFYPKNEWDGLIFVQENLVKDVSSISKTIGWKVYNPLLWPQQSRKLTKNLDQQNILIYTENTRLQKKFKKKNWSGRLNFDHDYFLGGLYAFSKNFPTRLIHKDLRYYLSFSDEKDELGRNKAYAEIRLTLENTSPYQDFIGYWRWILPQSSKLISSVNIQEKYPETVGIGEKIDLKAKENKSYVYRYELPSSIWNETNYVWTYSSQSAWKNDTLSFVAYAPPSLSIQSEALDIHEDIGITTIPLDRDHHIDIQFLEDKTAPKWTSITILSPNKIKLGFSEVMGPSAEDPSRYLVSGAAVLSVTKNKTFVTLEVDSLGTKARDIEILLKGLRDLNGNSLEPEEPRTSFLWSQEWIDLFIKPVQDTEVSAPIESTQTSL